MVRTMLAQDSGSDELTRTWSVSPFARSSCVGASLQGAVLPTCQTRDGRAPGPLLSQVLPRAAGAPPPTPRPLSPCRCSAVRWWRPW